MRSTIFEPYTCILSLAAVSGMYGILRSLGLEPGGEFKAGIEEADKIGEMDYSLSLCTLNEMRLLVGCRVYAHNYSVYLDDS